MGRQKHTAEQTCLPAGRSSGSYEKQNWWKDFGAPAGKSIPVFGERGIRNPKPGVILYT